MQLSKAFRVHRLITKEKGIFSTLETLFVLIAAMKHSVNEAEILSLHQSYRNYY